MAQNHVVSGHSKRAARPAAATIPRGAAVCCAPESPPSPSPVDEGASPSEVVSPPSLEGTVVAEVVIPVSPAELVVVTTTSLLTAGTVELTTVDRPDSGADEMVVVMT